MPYLSEGPAPESSLRSVQNRTNFGLLGSSGQILLILPSFGLDGETMIILDALRKQRNVADYSGDLVAEAAADECMANAAQLWDKLNQWLKSKHPELIK